WIAQWSFPIADKNQPGSLYLTGVISVNEELNAERLQKSISAKSSDGENMKVMVEPSSVDPDAFEIRIHPISRKEKAYDLLLEWETSSEDGASRKKNLSYRIPSVSEFAVMGIDDSKAAAGSLQVFFSDPLAEDQDISGLVKLKGETAVLQLVKESDLIRVSLPEAYAAEAGTLLINESIRSVGGMSLRAEYQHVFQLKQIKPQVRITDKGSILPYSDKVILPFEAINLHTVEVEVFKTFSNNVLHHLHFGFDSDYDSYNMVRLGRVVKQKVFRLEDLAPGSNAKEWKRYGIDISELIQAESGAYYQIRIGFKPEHSNYACTGDKPEIPEDFYDENSGDPDIYSFWREYPYYDYREGADYDPEDPCRLSYYYRAHFAKVSLLASNIAMIVKSAEAGSQQLAFVYDILDGTPVKGAEVSWYDPQLQLLTTQKTDGLGMVERKGAQLPAFAVAKYGKHFSYLKVADGRSLSLSEFDVSGVQMQDGLKASLYTERGVWRPGDTICLNAILHQFGTPIPDRFPVVLTVTNPRGQVVYNKQLSEHLMGLFTFQIPTGESDLTGLYKASLKAGLSEFEKNLLVETVKPNRFKVEWPLQSQTPLSAFAKGIQMKAAWLHGSPASGAHANVQLRYKMVAPVFKQYAAYNFVDPEYQSITGEINLYDGELDESGEAEISSSVLDGLLKTGKLHTTLISKISAADGDISTDYMDTEVATFKEFVGIKMPESPYGRQLTAGTDHEVKILVVDEKGNPLPNRKVQLELYQVSYEWWYELRNAYRSDYQRQDYKTKLKTAQLTTDQNGLATYVLNVGEYDRFYLNVTHMGNKYSAGVHFYTGWAYDRNQTEFVNILKFKANKEVYQIGDEAVIELPGAARGRYLINLLRGNRVVKHQTIEAQQGQTVYKFALTAEMAPNIYVDVTYLQGKDQKNNDLPLRLYGVLPVRVEDPSRKLLPKISMPDQLRPDEKFSVEVSEEQSRTMAYQLFIVDEGLLNLTRFKTPDPYQDMMAKEALTMMTWDNFNEVIGGSNAGLEKIFSIGGDLAAKAADEEKNK
ncbi:MAG TPA: MG2 domain-containing protein, partial [Saprospiraceae bacterium]|nr:MG2 domain-containing protein [Saprospiraceae bacterium]